MRKRKIGFEINHCARIIRRYMDASAVKRCADEVTGTHSWAIGYLYFNRDRDIFQKDFEKEFDIRRSTASNILSLMEKNGLIVRQSVDYDARLKKIVLTQKAIDLHYKIEESIAKMEEGISEGITEEEMESFLKTIDKIKANIERMSV